MSEAFDKVSGITRIPIFPLPLVMIPNELLPLHIFEPRYRQMLDDIKPPGNELFGINFLDTAQDFADRPEIGAVGCVAELRSIEVVADERSNILTSGLIRYRLLSYADSDSPYLLGNVEFFEDTSVSGPEIDALAEEVFGLFDRMARAAFNMTGNRGTYVAPPRSDPETLSFLITGAFDLNNDIKYEMLRTDSTMERLMQLREILGNAIGKIEENADILKAAQTNGHSKKTINLD